VARHRKSKVNRVTVNPNATQRYVVGVLTGADKYIMGLLTGTQMYQNWAEVEGQLEGKPLTPYVQDQLKNYMSNPENMARLRRLIYNPEGLDDEVALSLLNTLTNYKRVKEVDEYMIEKGKEYKDNYYAESYRSKSPQFGLNMLESMGTMSGVIKDRVGNVLSKLVYNL
jgi:hypothetical protein